MSRSLLTERTRLLTQDHPDAEEFVYLLEAVGTEFLKIGWAAGPHRVADRVRSIQTACPYEIRLVAVLPGGRQLERELHARFATRRERGEWFWRDGEILLAFQTLRRGPLLPIRA